MSFFRWVATAAATLAAVLGAVSSPAMAQQLTVSAAASLTDALREIGPRFEAARPGVTLRFNFAASGLLLQQIVQGAPVDVFVSADEETVARGVEQKVLDDTSRRIFAGNTLVLIRPTQGGPELRALADLARPEVRRIAIGKPATVAAGRYAQQALAAAQLWEPLQPRFVPADTVRQVLDYVARGEVEAGLLFGTDAALMPDKVQVVAVVGGHAPIRYPAVVVSDSRNRALAAAFIAFLATPAAQDVLARRGFAKP
jgi:molybdate transport system substrate-binding protein